MIRSAATRLASCLCALLVCAAPAVADPLREETSLGFVPADAAFYGTMLRNREQFDAVVNSRAAAKFMQLPAVQSSVQMMQFLIDPASAFEGMEGLEGPGFDPEGFGEPGGEGVPGEEGNEPGADGLPGDGQFQQPAADEELDPNEEPAFGEDEPSDEEFPAGDESQPGDFAPGEFAPGEDLFPTGPSFTELLADPANQELLVLLGDAVSHEVFVYGGEGYLSLFELAAFASAVQADLATPVDFTGTPEEIAQRDAERDRQLTEKLLEFLEEHPEALRVPELIFGFKVTDPAPATSQIARLEAALKEATAADPLWKDRVVRESLGGTEYLILKLDGGMIPWDEFIAEEAPEDQELARDLAERLKPVTAVLSIGLREDYVLISVGPTNERLASLGQGELLVDRAELAPAAADPERRFTSIGYVSAEFMVGAARSQGTFQQLADTAESVIDLMDEWPLELRERMLADVRAFAVDLQRYEPRPGAAMSYSFLTDRGIEGYDYNWGEELGYDASQQLTILEHVGGDPLFFSAARHATSLEDYDFFVKWFTKYTEYASEASMLQFPPEERQAMQAVMQQFAPLLKRVDEITRTQLAPALDGQAAFVLDADLTSKAWNQALPTETPLPMLEIGLVLGLRDAEKLKEAAAAYFDVAQQALIQASAFGPTGGPPPALPLPKTRDFDGHSISYYVLPKELGFDKRIAPNAGVSQTMAAVSLLPLFTQRLLQPATLTPDGPLGAHYGQPLAAATRLDFAGTVDALRPWIDLAIDGSVEAYNQGLAQGLEFGQQAVEEPAGPADEQEQPEDDAGGRFGDDDEASPPEEEPGAEGFDQGFGEQPGVPQLADLAASADEIKAQVSAVLDILSCFRGYSSVTYQENGAWVTHRESRFEDLPEE